MPGEITASALPEIPVVETGPAFPMATLLAAEPQAHALFDASTRYVPRAALRGLDAVSRRWLARQRPSNLVEIDAIAQRLARPGAYFLSVNYEWGCTVAVGPSPDGRSATLARTLDWALPGLGRNVLAAKVAGASGPFVTLTWPGYAGVLQAMAPGRFSAALNQAPMRRLGGGAYALDWAVNRAKVWRLRHQTAAHLLRRVFEEAHDFAEARAMLIGEPIAAPATYSLAGIRPHDTCVVERTETAAHVVDGRACTTNHWQGLDHGARPRGHDSPGRLAAIAEHGAFDLDARFAWLVPPVLNENTRIAMIANAASGRLVARGFEAMQSATAPAEIIFPAG